MVGNVIVQCELLLISIFQFLRSQKNFRFIHDGHFEFKTLKKSLAHLDILGNVIWIISDLFW